MIGLAAVAALAAALAIVEQRERRNRTDPEVAANRGMAVPRAPGPARVAIAALLIVAAVGVGAGSVWTIVRIGESGSRAVWEARSAISPSRTEPARSAGLRRRRNSSDSPRYGSPRGALVRGDAPWPLAGRVDEHDRGDRARVERARLGAEAASTS